jgi:hypothetical protein
MRQSFYLNDIRLDNISIYGGPFDGSAQLIDPSTRVHIFGAVIDGEHGLYVYQVEDDELVYQGIFKPGLVNVKEIE